MVTFPSDTVTPKTSYFEIEIELRRIQEYSKHFAHGVKGMDVSDVNTENLKMGQATGKAF